jgi:hypothetical protein
VPDGGGQGEDALQDAGQHAGWGVAAVALQVELAFEGVVEDSMTWRSGLKNRAPGRSGSPLRAGRGRLAPALASCASKSRP